MPRCVTTSVTLTIAQFSRAATSRMAPAGPATRCQGCLATTSFLAIPVSASRRSLSAIVPCWQTSCHARNTSWWCRTAGSAFLMPAHARKASPTDAVFGHLRECLTNMLRSLCNSLCAMPQHAPPHKACTIAPLLHT
eukprot:2570394-Amphidinium_carterae.2